MQLVILAWWLLLSGVADILAAIAGYVVVLALIHRRWPKLEWAGVMLLAIVGLPLGTGALWLAEWAVLLGYADLLAAIAGYIVAYFILRRRHPEIFAFGASVCAITGLPIGIGVLWCLERLVRMILA